MPAEKKAAKTKKASSTKKKAAPKKTGSPEIADLYLESSPEARPELTKSRIGIWILVAIITGLAVLLFGRSQDQLAIDRDDVVTEGGVEIPRALTQAFETDFSQISVDPDLLLSGGPGKDGIPALFDPEFESLSNTTIADTTRGILVERNGEKKFYPYNILVWHEIVNDTVGGDELAMTFCPLCGSAIVFNRTLNEQQLDFKVSGLLYESNMVMYDTTTESFFSQSIGRGIAGAYNDQQLSFEQFQLLELFEVKENHPDAQIMTTNTGHSRDYSFYPYGNYDNQEGLYFPVQHEDDRYSGKEIFYIVPVDGDSIAIRVGEVASDGSFTSEKYSLRIEKQGSEVFVYDTDDNLLPGYFEMWFSWATQHPDSGSVIDPSKQ